MEKDKDYPLIGNFINYHIVKNNIKKGDIARELGMLPNGFTALLKRKTMQFEALWKLSHAMQHNFFAQLGEYLPYHFETRAEKQLKTELAEKEATIQKLELQLEIMKELMKK